MDLLPFALDFEPARCALRKAIIRAFAHNYDVVHFGFKFIAGTTTGMSAEPG